MIIFVISLILGVAKIIPQTDFDGWRIAMTFEIVAEFAGVVIWVLYKAYIQPLIKRRNTPKPIVKKVYVQDYSEVKNDYQIDELCGRCVYDDNSFPLPNPRCYQCDGVNRFESKDEIENPYEEGRIWHYIWEENHADE